LSKERFSQIKRRGVLALAGGLTLGGSILSGCGSDSPSSPVPPGFSREASDYKWRITVDMGNHSSRGNAEEVVIFSNDKPQHILGDGVAQVKATNAYCPLSGGDNGHLRDEAGCTTEFMSEISLTSSRMISVSDNQGVQTPR
jgi:hypothetical protein